MNEIALRNRLSKVLTNPLYTNAIYLIANTMLTSLIGFFFWMIVARFYNQVEVGFSSAIISVLNLLANLSLIGLNISIIRFLPHSEKPQDFINTCFTFGGFFSLIVTVIFLSGLNLWSPTLSFITHNAIFTSVFLALALVSTLSLLVDSVFLAKRRAEFAFFKNIIVSLLKLPLPIIFLIYFKTFGIISSWGIPLGIALAISLFFFLPKIQKHYKPVLVLDFTLLRNMWRYSSNNYMATLLHIAPTLLLPVIVINLLGPEQNAFFYIAWMIASLLFSIPAAASRSLFIESSHFENKIRINMVKSLKFTFLILIPMVALILFMGQWLLNFFGDSYPTNALLLLQILAVSSLPIGINNIYTSILRVTNRIKELLIIWGLMSVAILITSYTTIAANGIIAIGYAWLGFQGITSIYAIFRMKSHHSDRRIEQD
ncbi:lipopolysaccharide biosynthesis protein [Chloroflexota bacterium]